MYREKEVFSIFKYCFTYTLKFFITFLYKRCPNTYPINRHTFARPSRDHRVSPHYQPLPPQLTF